MTRNTTTRLAAANKQFQFCSGSEFLEIKRRVTRRSLALREPEDLGSCILLLRHPAPSTDPVPPPVQATASENAKGDR